MGLEMSSTLLVLVSPSPQVPPAHPKAKDYPAKEAKSVVLSLGVWFQRRAPQRQPASACALIFIIRAVPVGPFCCCSSHEAFVNTNRHVPC